MISPLAPKEFAALPPIDGVLLATADCGIRYEGRSDLLGMAFREGTTVAGVFTRSTTAGPPVAWCRACLPRGHIRGLIVNSGNANVFTGRRGQNLVRATAETAAAILKCAPEEVFISSTGVIGELPPQDRIISALPELFQRLGPDGWADAAAAIMTTDTYPKIASRKASIDGSPVTINGIAKGSGMIMPNMATMLAYIVTDACLSASQLQQILNAATSRTFNCITVDGDTSTSDTVLLAATAAVRHTKIRDMSDDCLREFRAAIEDISMDLSHQVVKDGEGATKFIRVSITGAVSDESARNVALSIANSPLVKTAIAASDANWGRIVMAAGKSLEPIDHAAMEIRMGGVLIALGGARVDRYDEEPITRHLQGPNVEIDITIGNGLGKSTIWTCDLTHGYIDINGHYRS